MWLTAKLAGAACVMAACMLAGAALEQRLKCRWQIFREMHEVLVFLEKEMTYHQAPVQEAFGNAAQRCSTVLSRALTMTAEQIGAGSGMPFAGLWEASLACCFPAGLFTEEERRVFLDTAGALCNADTVMQRTLLGKYADRFRTMSGTEEEACREKGGLYRKLAAAAGIFLVILLI